MFVVVQKLKIQFTLQLLQIVFQKLDIHRLDSFILVQKVQGTQLTNDEINLQYGQGQFRAKSVDSTKNTVFELLVHLHNDN